MGISCSVWAQGLPGSDDQIIPAKDAAKKSSNTTGGQDTNDVENLYDKEDAKPLPKQPGEPDHRAELKNEVKRRRSVNVQSLSDLAKLAPFSDVAVIEKRFLPKTNRFEVSAGGFTNLNNPFFQVYGLDLSAAYYLTEKYAVEGIADIETSAAREVTNDLSSHRNIQTTNLVTSKGFYGAAFKWNPIYGKITWLNKSIVPFDLNFSAGGGMTQTTDGQSVPTLHLGTSQVFAYTKSMAFRWEFTWNMYQANATDQNGNQAKITQSDIYLGIGVSFYFPEATYR